MKVELAGHYSIGKLLRTCVPMVAMMVVTSVYSIVDGLFISNFAGSTSFAAMNIIWPAIALASAFGLMIGTGGSALVAKTLGEGDPDRARSIFTMLVWLCIVIGSVIAVVMFIFMRPLTEMLGAEGDMIQLAVIYGRIVICSLPLFMLQLAFQSFYMTAERPQLGTVMSIVSGCANIALDALFVAGFGWGLTGAAVATAIALSAGGIFPLWYFSSRRNTSHLALVPVRAMDWKAMGKSCANGLSEWVGNIAFSIVGICYNLQLMKYIGENGVSAYGVLMYIGFVFAAIFIGYNLCVSQVISFNYGAGNVQELRSLFRKSLKLIAAAGLVIVLISEVAAPVMAGIFVGYDEQLDSLTVHALRIYMLSFLICGFNLFCSAWFTALGNGVVSAAAAFARTLVFELSAVWILPLLLGIDGIWMAVNFAEIMALLLSVALFICFNKKYLRQC